MAKTKQNLQPVHIPEDTTEYVILACYPGEKDFEVLGVGTKAFGLEMGLKMDRDVNIGFM